MALIEFKNLPDTSTPINAENLNHNFNSIAESGSNSNGIWVKLADGTMFQRGKTLITPTANSTVVVTVNLPQTFTSVEYANCNPLTGVPNNVRTSINEMTNSTIKIAFYRTNSEQTDVCWEAIGKWK